MEEDLDLSLERQWEIESLMKTASGSFLDKDLEAGRNALLKVLRIADEGIHYLDPDLFALRRHVSEELWENKCYDIVIQITTENITRLEAAKHESLQHRQLNPNQRAGYQAEAHFIHARALAESGSLQLAIKEYEANRFFCESQKKALGRNFTMIKCIIIFQLSKSLQLNKSDYQDAELTWTKLSKDVINGKVKELSGVLEPKLCSKFRAAISSFERGEINGAWQAIESVELNEVRPPDIIPFPPPVSSVFYMWKDKIFRAIYSSSSTPQQSHMVIHQEESVMVVNNFEQVTDSSEKLQFPSSKRIAPTVVTSVDSVPSDTSDTNAPFALTSTAAEVKVFSTKKEHVQDAESQQPVHFFDKNEPRCDESEAQNDGRLLSTDFQPLSEKALRADAWFEKLRSLTHPLIYGRRNQFKNCKIHGKPYKRVLIAVIDTGVAMLPCQPSPNYIIDNKHCFQEGKAFGEGLTTWKQDLNGHGTAVASLVLKVCPNATVMMLRVPTFKGEDGSNSIDPHKTAKAIQYAQKEGADIISMSLGWKETYKEVETAIHNAAASTVIFAATGNDGVTGFAQSMRFPARDDNVISVDRADGKGEAAVGDNPPFNRNEKDVSYRFTAPGIEVLSAWPPSEKSKNGEKRCSGASFSTPIAVGIAALVLEFARQPPLGVCDDIQSLLKKKQYMNRILRDMCSVQTGNFYFLSPWETFHVDERPHLRAEELDDDPYGNFSARNIVANSVLTTMKNMGYNLLSQVVIGADSSIKRFKQSKSETW